MRNYTELLKPASSFNCRREKRVRTKRERRMTARKEKTRREKRRKARVRVTNKPSQCFNLDCTERGELFST